MLSSPASTCLSASNVAALVLRTDCDTCMTSCPADDAPVRSGSAADSCGAGAALAPLANSANAPAAAPVATAPEMNARRSTGWLFGESMMPPGAVPGPGQESESRTAGAWSSGTTLCPSSMSRHSAQRPESQPHLVGEDLRLLPGRKVPALGDLVEMDEIVIREPSPAFWGRVELVRKGGHGNRQGDALGGEEGQLALPVQPSRRDRRLRQPVERDVVEDVVSREALGLSVEDAGDERVAPRVVIEHPGRETDGRVHNRVKRLRTKRHLIGVAQPRLVEKGELVVGVLFVG